RGVGRRRDAARGEGRNGELPFLRDLRDEIERSAEVLRFGHELLGAERLELFDLCAHGAKVLHGLDDVARTRLALGANHRRPFADAAQRFADVAASAYERHGERSLVDVELL